MNCHYHNDQVKHKVAELLVLRIELRMSVKFQFTSWIWNEEDIKGAESQFEFKEVELKLNQVY